MNRLQSFFIFLVWMYTTAETVPEYADVVILVDGSDSMGDKAFTQVKALLNKVITNLPLGADKYRIALVQYNEDAHTEFQFSTYKARNPMLNYLKKSFLYKGGTLKTGNALTKVHETHFKGTTVTRDTDQFPQILLVITSGTSLDGVQQPALELRKDGVKIIAVGLQKASLANLQAMASAPYLVHEIPSVKEILQFSQSMSEIIVNVTKTEYAIPGPAATPTLGTTAFAGPDPTAATTVTTNATTNATSYVNDCAEATLADVVFLIDGSVDGDVKNVELIKEFLNETIHSLDVREGCIRIGLVMYSNTTQVISLLGQHTQKDDVLNLVRNLSASYGKAYTGAAINFTNINVFGDSKGSRKNQGIQQIAVLLTHRPSNDSIIEAALNLRRDHVTFFVVGIQDADPVQLAQIASHPPDKYTHQFTSFSNLTDLRKIFWKNVLIEVQQKVLLSVGKTQVLQTACIDTEEADIYFLIDGSGSIQTVDFQEMKSFLVEVVEMFNIGPQTIRVGAVQFSDIDYISLEIPIDAYSHKKDLKMAIQNIRQPGGGTRTGAALDYMLPLIKAGSSSRPAKVPRYLIVLTDGQSQDTVHVPAERLRGEKVHVYAIGVKEANQTQLLEIAGKKERVHFVENFDSLKDIKNQVVQQICSNEACKEMKADIMFLVDGSGSIGPENFEKMKVFMRELVNKTDIGIDQVQVGVVQFSHTNQEEFQMNKHVNKRDIQSAIDTMTALDQGTLTGGALGFVSDYFKPSKGARAGVKQFLILITDGVSQDEVRDAAAALRGAGIIIYSVGVYGANITQLEEISGKPELVFYVENFDVLKKIEDELLLGICSPYEECKRIERADIVFVIDTSGSIDNEEYATMKEFMLALVNKSDVGPNQVQFGALRYSDSPQTVFYLNDHDSKSKVIEVLQTDLPTGGNTYTADALRHSETLFTEKYGSRRGSGVPQILIVITDGESHDKELLNGTAQRLRDQGIVVYAIGIDKANTGELLTMSGSPEKMFFVNTFDGLKEIYSKISEIVCTNTPPVCEVQKADIVFLIDGSTSIGDDDFKVMKDFMESMAAEFDTRPGQVQIGVAQYSHHYQDEFRLSSSPSAAGMKSKIGGIAQVQGNTLIGKALESVGRSLFNSNAGCRINEGVQQFLLVITDGKSQDEVAQAAEALRKRSINIYALGVGDISPNQLLQIAGTPDKKFTVHNFNELASIKKRIVRNICKEDSKSNCLIDIVMGFDISTQTEGQKLLDGQSQLEVRLPEILQGITSLSSVSCGLGTNTQAGLALHVKNAVMPISSKFQIYSKEIEKNLKALTVNAPTRLDASYLYSLWATFQNKSTAQAKVIVVFTDGLDGDIEKLEKVSEQLRNEGLNALITVVLEGATDVYNIQHIEFGRGFGYRTQLSVGMRDIGKRLFKALSNVAEKACCCAFCKCFGDDGTIGPYGKPGTKGRIGLKGVPGHAGEEGSAGEQGVQGLQGQQGLQGCSGTPGQKGIRGIHGKKGDAGDDGLDGVPGEQGTSGSPGHKGARGDSGYQGSTGTRGSVGERGDQGFRGDPGDSGADNVDLGPAGARGEPGEKGDPGKDGQPGAPGDRGKSNLEGRKGSPGPQGQNGATGLAGEPGAPGFPGPEGAKGVLGERGRKGNEGPRGVLGAFGPEGANGVPGVPGRRGSKGLPGDPGVKGDLGPAGWHGTQGEDGRDGYGLPGRKGSKGQEGYPGYSGPKGESGDSGLPGDAGKIGSRGKRSIASTPGEAGWPGSRGPPGRMGSKGQKGQSSLSPCDLIEFVRSKCPCTYGKSDCPVYPTELTIALDMSKDTTQDIFDKMRDIVLSVLGDLNIREGNCPTDARVAILSYNQNIKYLVRFSDFYSRKQLLTAIKGIPFKRSSGGRDIGRTMRFVARNVFKRTLHGSTVRKVAMFFSNGQSEDAVSIHTAVMEFSALGIIPVVIAFNNVPHVQNAFKMDSTGAFQVLKVPSGGDYASVVKKLKLCTLCYDRCKVETTCHQDIDLPPKIGTDVVFLLDSSQNVREDQLLKSRALLTNLIDNFDIAKQPKTSDVGDRVALVSLASQGYTAGKLENPHIEFDLLAYGNKNKMKKHIRESVHQLKGTPALGHTLQWTVDNMLVKAPQPRKNKLLFVISAGETSYWDKVTLQEASLKAKCLGHAIFVVSIGPHFNNTELEDLVSIPVDHHLVQLGRVQKPDIEYVTGFIQPFVNALKYGINKYPSTDLRKKCARTSS